MILFAILLPAITSHLLPTIFLKTFILKPAPASTVQVILSLPVDITIKGLTIPYEAHTCHTTIILGIRVDRKCKKKNFFLNFS